VKPEENNVVGEGAAGKSSPRASRDKRGSNLSEGTHNGDRFVAVAWKYSQPRFSAVSRQSVGVVNEQVAVALEHETVSNYRSQFFR
jgi:hypothetical protein